MFKIKEILQPLHMCGKLVRYKKKQRIKQVILKSIIAPLSVQTNNQILIAIIQIIFKTLTYLLYTMQFNLI